MTATGPSWSSESDPKLPRVGGHTDFSFGVSDFCGRCIPPGAVAKCRANQWSLGNHGEQRRYRWPNTHSPPKRERPSRLELNRERRTV